MFVISPVSALHSHPSYNSYAAPHSLYSRHTPSARDRYLAAIAQAEADYAHAQAIEQQRAREVCARRQREREENLRRQLVLDALRAQQETKYDEDYGYDYDVGYAPVYPGYRSASLKRPYNAYAQELAERRAHERQAALEHAARERGAALERAAREREARIQEWKRLAEARRQQEEARRATETQKFIDMFARAQPTQKQQLSKQESAQRAEAEVPLKDKLESRLMNEYESDIRDTLQSLLDSIMPSHPTEASTRVSESAAEPTSESTKDTKGKSKQVTFDLPTTETAASDSETDSEAEAAANPASIQSSLSTINDIDASFRTLESEFEFPEELDFVSANDGTGLKLAYSSRNAPLRFYDHALSQLLSKLDAVPSYGSKKVRDARKQMVRKVEMALEETEKEVERKKEVAVWKAAKAAALAASEVETKVDVVPEPAEVPEVEMTTTVEEESVTPITSQPSESELVSSNSPSLHHSTIEEERSVDPVIQSPDDATIEASSATESTIISSDNSETSAEPLEVEMADVAKAESLVEDPSVQDSSVPLDEAPEVVEKEALDAEVVAPPSMPISDPVPIEVEQLESTPVDADVSFPLDDAKPIRESVPSPTPESVAATSHSGLEVETTPLMPITTDVAPSDSDKTPEHDEPVTSPVDGDAPVVVEVNEQYVSESPVPSSPSLSLSASTSSYYPAPTSLSFSHLPSAAPEVEPISPSTESNVSDEDEDAVMGDEEGEVGDAPLLAADSPSLSLAPSPQSNEEEDVVLIDSDEHEEHEEDMWSEVEA